LAYVAVENPVRFSRSLVQSRQKTYAVGAATTFASLAVASAAIASTWVAPRTTLDAQIEGATRNYFPNLVAMRSPSGVDYGAGGDLTSSTVVLLVGDSHAAMWSNALAIAARSAKVRLAIHSAPGCPAIGLAVLQKNGGGLTPEQCTEWRKRQNTLVGD